MEKQQEKERVLERKCVCVQERERERKKERKRDSVCMFKREIGRVNEVLFTRWQIFQ